MSMPKSSPEKRVNLVMYWHIPAAQHVLMPVNQACFRTKHIMAATPDMTCTAIASEVGTIHPFRDQRGILNRPFEPRRQPAVSGSRYLEACVAGQQAQ